LLVEEQLIPVREDVRAACEILGLDPLSVACEGRFAAWVATADAARAQQILRASSASATVIGRVTEEPGPNVFLKSTLGVQRVLDLPSGEPLPRIC
jgi:hydrogenase expression/formation protein HypE